MDRFEFLPRLAKALTDSNSKVGGESTMYSIPHLWNHTEKMRSKEDLKFDQNPKRLRGKRNTKWSGSFRAKSALLAKKSAEDTSNSKACISWLNGGAIQMMSPHGNQE
jgi:hypothetical protein